MLGTVQLNDQTDLMAGEIDEVSADGTCRRKCVPSIEMRDKCLQSLASASVAPERRRRLFVILKRSIEEGFLTKPISPFSPGPRLHTLTLRGGSDRRSGVG